MEKSLITNFALKQQERGLLSAFSILFDFSLIALFLSVLNQSGVFFSTPLTADSIMLSDMVSVLSESFSVLSCVGLMAVLCRSLFRMVNVSGLKLAKSLTTVAIVVGIIYIVVGKFCLLVYGTENLSSFVDFLGSGSAYVFFAAMFFALAVVQVKLSVPLQKIGYRGFLSLVSGFLLLLGVPFIGLTAVPEWVLTLLFGGGLFCFMLAFSFFVLMMSMNVEDSERVE